MGVEDKRIFRPRLWLHLDNMKIFKLKKPLQHKYKTSAMFGIKILLEAMPVVQQDAGALYNI